MDSEKLLHTDDLSSDDEESTGNTIGRVPLHWYDAYDHIGYNVGGSKVVKRKGVDRLDLTIANRDSEESKRTVYDMYNDREVVLSEREFELIRRMQAGAFAHPEHDDTPDYIDYYSSQKEVMPLWATDEPKRRFVPSKWELMKVMKIVKSMKEGKFVSKLSNQYRKYRGEEDEESDKRKEENYMIWDDAEDEILAESGSRRMKYHLPAPKMPLPGHAESYNPPEEYLLSPEEVEEKLRDYRDSLPEAVNDEEDAKNKDKNKLPSNLFIPKKFKCLRHVPGYDNLVRERYERCLDLYLCPRSLKKRLNIDPTSLIPQLPKPKELKPYPNTLCLQYIGHRANTSVKCLSVSPDGQYLVSGGEDGTVRLWDVSTGYCRYVWQIGREVATKRSSEIEDDAADQLKMEAVLSVQWNPHHNHHVIAAAVGKRVVFIATGTGDSDATEITDSLLSNTGGNGAKDEDEDESGNDSEEEQEQKKKKGAKRGAQSDISWTAVQPSTDASSTTSSKRQSTLANLRVGPRMQLEFPTRVLHLAWHHKGDYLVSLTEVDNASNTEAKSVAVHQLSKGTTQHPFRKSAGRVQSVVFHPTRPFLFIVTQQHVKVFHLTEQKLVKNLVSNCKWLSSIDVHPSGDHVIVGSYDRRVVWFDLDLSSAPYKTLKFHERAVRSVQYHKRYPLMASASDDGSVHIFHAAVFSDLSRNPMIVPLKILKDYHRPDSAAAAAGTTKAVTSVVFHPRQPWVFSAGADGVINLFQDI